MIALVTSELRRQQRRLADARTELGLTEVCMGWANAVTAEHRAECDRASHRLGQIKAQCWPISTLESLPTLAIAVISEIAHRPHCASCEGRGQTLSGELLTTCKACGGSGLGQVGDRRRAAPIGRDESTCRSKWRGVYEWLLQRMTEAEQDACSAMGAVLDRVA